MKPEQIYILIAGEESQAICLAFRALGFQAFSCDLKPCSGGHLEWHLQMDMFKAIKLRHWDMVMFHPVCKYMAVSGLHWNKSAPGRAQKTEESLQQVCDCLNCGILHIGLENPVSCISTRVYKDIDGLYRVLPPELKGKLKSFKPTQIIQPWAFGHPESKATCLWLINLPILKPTQYADFKKYRCKCGYTFESDLGKYGCANCAGTYAAVPMWDNQTRSGQNKLGPSDDRDELRSKTYPGIAKAMAEQWGEYLLENII